MPRTGLAYERPSLVSLALIVGFSLAVVVVAGWLVMMIMFSNDANTKAADPAAPDRSASAADVTALADTSAPRAENVPPSNAPPGAALAAPFAAPPPAGASTAALVGPAPEMTYRGPGDLLNFPPDDENAASDAVPLPPPRPRRTAAVPVPRPRPRPPINGEQAPPASQQRSLLDIFVGGRQP